MLIGAGTRLMTGLTYWGGGVLNLFCLSLLTHLLVMRGGNWKRPANVSGRHPELKCYYPDG